MKTETSTEHIKNNLIDTEPVSVIFMGLQGSGKSTCYRQMFAGRYIHINLDTLKTRAQERSLFEECLTEQKSFVVDNTNPTKADRARYIPAAKTAGYRIVGFFFQSRLQECISRNNQRTGKAKIPASAIAATSNRLEMPAYDEGFDELYFISLDDKPDPVTGEFRIVVSEWSQDV